jgi:hypothetical protein
METETNGANPMIRDEFVFSVGDRKLYKIEDFSYIDDILHQEDLKFWDNVKKGYVIVFMPKIKKYEKEPELVFIAKMPVEDAKKKFG